MRVHEVWRGVVKGPPNVVHIAARNTRLSGYCIVT
jgi:hypothetical protein